MHPTKGRIVMFTQPDGEKPHNGERIHPAIITHVWGADMFPALNLTVFPDNAPPYPVSSVSHTGRADIGEASWEWPEIIKPQMRPGQ